MEVIKARNVNHVWPLAKTVLNTSGVRRPSRVGEVLEVPFPVTTVYERPTERVLFDEQRDANPFFHLMEALWMLAGRDDIAFPVRFNKRFISFSDDGETEWGAYGYRWRHFFNHDQLRIIIRRLKEDKNDRRCVLGMWDPRLDLDRKSVDVPCNTNIYFKIRNDALDMVVCCRSNDVVWGAYGANVVHMSVLQEYMAAMIGVPVGYYYQVSDSWHAYTERWEKYGGTIDTDMGDPYSRSIVNVCPLVTSHNTFQTELKLFLSETELNPDKYYNEFFKFVAIPMLLSWREFENKENQNYLLYARDILPIKMEVPNNDWIEAAFRWLTRRLRNKHSQLRGDKQR